ncbi:MAG: hypothetical protein ACRERD_17655, partial [Candidatus Binatia bacterium]
NGGHLNSCGGDFPVQSPEAYRIITDLARPLRILQKLSYKENTQCKIKNTQSKNATFFLHPLS